MSGALRCGLGWCRRRAMGDAAVGVESVEVLGMTSPWGWWSSRLAGPGVGEDASRRWGCAKASWMEIDTALIDKHRRCLQGRPELHTGQR